MKSAFYALIFSFVLMASIAFSADTISPEDAINHIGQQATVCGNVASTHFSSRSKGQPTFINLNRPYPNQIFTILIWGSIEVNSPVLLKVITEVKEYARPARSSNIEECRKSLPKALIK